MCHKLLGMGVVNLVMYLVMETVHVSHCQPLLTTSSAFSAALPNSLLGNIIGLGLLSSQKQGLQLLRMPGWRIVPFSQIRMRGIIIHGDSFL